jgi:thioredoxin 1
MAELQFSDSNFDGEVVKSDKPVLVDFWAPWCGPCRILAPLVDELSQEYTGKIKVGKLNTDDNSEVATTYRIAAIPTLLFFKNGKVVDEKGQEIGFHDGVVFSTLGARHGFTVTKKTPDDQPYYIVSKDIEKNVLVVSQDKQNFTNTLSKTIQLEKINWINTVPEENKKYTAQIRYHGEFLKCTIKHGGSASAEVIFDNPVLVAPGQSIVLYDKDVVLGGGVVA